MRTLWIVAVLLVGVEGHLFQFETMIVKMTNRSGIFWYSSYGCYCGWGGRGQPQDPTDRCCFVHDCCYGKANGCDPKKDVYTYTMENGNIVCGGDTSCKNQVCECDKKAAVCFRNNLDTYNSKKYWMLSSKNCQDIVPC